MKTDCGKTRVLLGMSGGVDSSVAAWLLKEQGHEVIGVTMKVWPQDCISRAEDKCCGPQAVADARGVAYTLGIPHYVIDEAGEFERMVIDYFTTEYSAGRTPNPCVMCNEKLKFGNLLTKARALGATHVATGHYARIERDTAGRATLFKAADKRKDQSYFLFSLRQEQLAASLLPLGGLTKPEVRALAKKLGLKTYDKEDSQEICFVPGNDYTAFLRSHLGEKEFHPGGIYFKDGTFMGDHQGIEFYTVGQRKGLGGGHGRPVYVIDIDATTQRVIVGDYDDLLRRDCYLSQTNWNEGELSGPVEITTKIRYNYEEVRAVVHPLPGNRARLEFDEPQRSVSPGQAAVCYAGDRVIGGGWIERTELLPEMTKTELGQMAGTGNR
ncbi:MAG TPA: tRNA 2-thiouridine(34) synthase MnmA [Candidatus Methylacidiphilales bacterium]|nr:tRNA 2-thiouridine(34) synthase MnmA [Candidatus Methylacidiphilales bacterium]